jgi:hypothetical protein
MRPDLVLADLIPPGQRPIVHELVLAEGPAWEDWGFLASPVRGFGGVTVIRPGEPFRFSGKYGTRIYAYRAGEAPPAELTDAWKAEHPSARPPVEHVGFVALTSPLTRLEHTLAVEAVAPDALRLAVVEQHRVHAWPGYLVWLVPLVLVAGGAFGFVRLRRRRARSAVA